MRNHIDSNSQGQQDLSLEIGSRAWYDHTLRTELGYPSLQPWQLDGTINICNGGDVICIVATGAGKSALIQGPIVARQAMGEKPVGIVVVPTKGLADDQARAAESKGIKALALHQDSVRAASEAHPRHNLFEEIRTGEWRLVFLSPEMLVSKRFSALLDDADFLQQIKLIVVDECHLVDEWKLFRTPYQHIKRLRNRVPSQVAWVALSATIASNEFQSISEGLGFLSGRYKLFKEPVDQPTIKYVPRFFQHPVSSMLDFSTIIPYNMRSINEIPITIIFANTISFGRSLRLYLTRLLPSFLTGRARKYLIRGFHGMSSADYRKCSINALKAGTETRVLMCTNTAAFGLDIQEVNKEAVRLQGQMETVMVDFANASLDLCPRQVACKHWGESFVQPAACCSLHSPASEDEEHKSELALRVRDAKQLTTQNRRSIPGPSKFPPINKNIVLPAIISLLKEWRLRAWQSVPTRRLHDPAELLLSNELLKHLAIRVRACTSRDIFNSIMQGWKELDSWGEKLYSVVEVMRGTAEEFMSELESQQEIEDNTMEMDTTQPEGNLENIQEPLVSANQHDVGMDGLNDVVMVSMAVQAENTQLHEIEDDIPPEGVRRSKRLRMSKANYST
ncbi:DEAD/DEAH-box helicase, partial [Rhizoctonia solani AG-3 Rhs1AP]